MSAISSISAVTDASTYSDVNNGTTVTLADAVAAYSDTANAADSSKSLLQVLALNAFRAAVESRPRYVGTLEGTPVLRDSSKRDVQALVWLAATDSATPPVTKERTAGERSLATYLSQFTRVATSPIVGTAALESTEDVKNALIIMRDDAAAQKSATESAQTALEELAQSDEYDAWFAQLPAADSATVMKFVKFMRDADNLRHLPELYKRLFV